MIEFSFNFAQLWAKSIMQQAYNLLARLEWANHVRLIPHVIFVERDSMHQVDSPPRDSTTYRQRLILDEVNRVNYLSIAEICEQFGISEATARRDLNALAQAGKVHRIYAGCSSLEAEYTAASWTPMNLHKSRNYDEKVKLARRASQLCADGESVIINCGSTAFLLGQEICGRKIQVLTNYFPLIRYLIEARHADLNVIGGQYYNERSMFLTAENYAQSFYAGHYMFTSGSGLTGQGLYKADALSAMVEQKLMCQVQKLVVIVDKSKIGQRIGQLFVPAEQIDIVVTSADSDHEVIEQLRERGVEVILV